MKTFHFCVSVVQVVITKAPGEILGLAVVESGWGSILPTVVVANLLHGGPAERSGELSIGDRIMSVNSTSLVGLPITTCQNIIRVRREHGGQNYNHSDFNNKNYISNNYCYYAGIQIKRLKSK